MTWLEPNHMAHTLPTQHLRRRFQFHSMHLSHWALRCSLQLVTSLMFANVVNNLIWKFVMIPCLKWLITTYDQAAGSFYGVSVQRTILKSSTSSSPCLIVFWRDLLIIHIGFQTWTIGSMLRTLLKIHCLLNYYFSNMIFSLNELIPQSELQLPV